MTIRKSPNTLEDDELLELLNEEPLKDEIVPIDHGNDVLQFITTFNLQPGTERIKRHTLYLIYKVWSKAALKKSTLLFELDKYFEKNNEVYFINTNAIKLTHEAYKYFNNSNVRLKSKHWATHYENFLKFHSLSKGNFWIHEDILYFIYDKFTHATGLDKSSWTYLGKKTFGIYTKLYLPQKQTKNGVMVGLSDNIKQFFQIGQLERMMIEYSKEKKPKKAKGKKKKSSKPRSSSRSKPKA